MTARRMYHSTLMTCLLAIWATGCLEEHKVKTTIRADGTCERTITLNPGQKEVPGSPFPLPVDAGWDTNWTQSGDDKYILTYTKRFNNLEELSREYAYRADSGKIRIDLRVRKTFRWFYTYYDYVESYGRFSDYTLVDPRAVLTEDEIDRFTYGDTTGTLDNKKEEWVVRNLYEAIYRELVRGAEGLHDSLLTPDYMAAHKEEFFRVLTGDAGSGSKLRDIDSLLREQSSYRGTKAKIFGENGLTGEGLKAFAEVAARTFRSQAIGNLKGSIRSGWGAALEMLKGRGTSGESFAHSVILPGILLETNAPDVQGSTASWKFEIKRLQLRDYEMRATSRVINEWAIAVSGVIVLGLLVLLLVSLVHGKRR